MNFSKPVLSPLCDFYIFTLLLIIMTAMWAQIAHEILLLYSAYSNS